MGNVVKVCTQGVDERIVNALRSICTLSRHPARTVAFQLTGADEADICLLDPDADGAQAAWARLDPERSKMLLLLQPRAGVVPADAHVIGRPVLAARLLARLDLLARTMAEPAQRTDAAVATDARNEVPPPPPVAIPQRAQVAAPAQVSVLVVDDSVTIRTQVEQVLRQSGFSPTLAETGEEALQLLSRYRFDVVLLDVVLPGADGYQICRTIKKQLRQRAPAIVMLTSKSSPFDRVRGSLAGCDSYLTKPTSLSDLRAALDKHTLGLRTDTQGTTRPLTPAA